MTQAASAKLNSGYISRTYDTFRSGLSRSVQKVQAFIASMTRAAGGTYRVGYKRISEKLNVSKTSIWRGVGQDRMGEAYERKRNDGVSSYTYTGDLEQKLGRHVHTELCFYTEIFSGEIRKKTGEVIEIERRLYDTEVDVLSLIYAHTLSKAGKCEGNPQSIAEILCMNYYTAWRALDRLLAFGLIFRPKKGVNGSDKKNVYVANMKLIRRLQRKNKAPAKAEAEAEAERRAFYQAQESQRKRKAERYESSVFAKVPRYREAIKEQRKLEVELGTAEAQVELGTAKAGVLQLLQAKGRELRKRIATIEKQMNIIPARFRPEYYGQKQCEKCRGTGDRSDGTRCDCWLRIQT